MLLGDGGLTPPCDYGSDKKGADIIVGEAQHLCLAPNYGGPGLGVFGIRYNAENRLNIRATAGRYVGLGKDEHSQRALAMVLSTREQHIRREKATSNICSNQSFVASIAGAALLARGDKGMRESLNQAQSNASSFLQKLHEIEGIELAYPTTPFFNEILLETKTPVSKLLQKARESGIHLGIDVSKRLSDQKQAFLMSFSDKQTSSEIQKTIEFLKSHLGNASRPKIAIAEIPATQMRTSAPGLPQISSEELKDYYHKLGRLNLSPDDNVYPLGSCTMKYNPYINDYAAGLEGFTQAHPQAPAEDVQGCLYILHETQEIFKKMTGLAAVTTQPVAGAQGELVGIKMFQAYHADKGEQRDLILIPKSAHGTNPATATMAGFETKKVKGVPYGIVNVNANSKGQIDFQQIEELVQEHGKRIAGIMITNPNTSGIFESQFKQIAELIHSVDGLVYMDGANMNAIASQVNLKSLGVDAVHNNLHKTWTIPHGGGGPGDAIVAVSEKLVDFMPGRQVVQTQKGFDWVTPAKSIGSFHRHHGNFAHKVRCYTYLKALGSQGIRRMSGVAVLSANYLLKKLEGVYPWLPQGADEVERMHEFILTLNKEQFDGIQKSGTPKAQAIAKVGKLFLDFGMHAPTVAFPEMYGMMVEPTESFTKSELDRFLDVLVAINKLVTNHPEVLKTAPHFTPVRKVNEVDANKNLTLFETLKGLPQIAQNPVDPQELNKMSVGDVCEKIIEAHREQTKA
jgi:glycine dehydrogenase